MLQSDVGVDFNNGLKQGRYKNYYTKFYIAKSIIV
jgi:hypothetical protein